MPSLKGLKIELIGYPALKGWAKLFRPAGRDWILLALAFVAIVKGTTGSEKAKGRERKARSEKRKAKSEKRKAKSEKRKATGSWRQSSCKPPPRDP